MTDFERIEKILSFLKLTKNGLGKALGDKNGMRLTHIEKGRNRIAASLAKDIVNAFPDKGFNYDWILNGKGKMLLPGAEIPKSVQGTTNEEVLLNRIKDLEYIIETQKKLILELENARNLNEKKFKAKPTESVTHK